MALVTLILDSTFILLIPSSVALNPFKVVVDRLALSLVSVFLLTDKLLSLSA